MSATDHQYKALKAHFLLVPRYLKMYGYFSITVKHLCAGGVQYGINCLYKTQLTV